MATKIVIIEGSDLVGKTTFLEKLSKTINNGYIIKNSYKPRSVEESKKIQEQYNHILTILRKAAKNDDSNRIILLDRFYPSQMIYSFKRGKDEMNSRFYKRMDERMESIENAEVHFIWLFAPLDDLLKRFDNREEDYIQKEELKTIHERYEKFFHNCKLNKKAISNPDGESIDKAVDKALKFIYK